MIKILYSVKSSSVDLCKLADKSMRGAIFFCEKRYWHGLRHHDAFSLFPTSREPFSLSHFCRRYTLPSILDLLSWGTRVLLDSEETERV